MSTPITGETVWPELQRTRRAIVVVDVVESVRLMQANEADVIDRWRRFVAEVRSEVLPKHGGRLVKSLGDGMLLEFAHAPRAVAAAFEMQRCISRLDSAHALGERMLLRAGVHVAEIVADELDVYGNGVNVAARIAQIASPGGVSCTSDVVDDLLPGVDAFLQDAGHCFLKHFDEPVQVFNLSPATTQPCGPAAQTSMCAPTQHLPQPTQQHCIALLPLAAASASASDNTVAALLGDVLLTRLSRSPDLRVISRLSSEQFKVRALDASNVTTLTAATYLACGRVHRVAKGRQLFIELIDAATMQMVWADTFVFSPAGLLAPDEHVTPGIAQAIVDNLHCHALKKMAVTPLPNLDSQALRFAAIHLMHRQSKADFSRAFEMLEHLAQRHPKASEPQAWLAKWHVLQVTKGWLPGSETDVRRPMAHAQRALDLDPDSAMSMAMAAFVHCHIGRDLAAAQASLAPAIATNPNEPWVWLVKATLDSFLGDGQGSWQSVMRARNLSPLDPLKHYFDSLGASAAVAAGRFEDAQELAQLSLSKDPRHLPTLRALAIAQVHLGALDDARRTAARLLELQPGFTLAEYISKAPTGGEAMRRRWASALRKAGITR